jgi:hypothetical protein
MVYYSFSQISIMLGDDHDRGITGISPRTTGDHWGCGPTDINGVIIPITKLVGGIPTPLPSYPVLWVGLVSTSSIDLPSFSTTSVFGFFSTHRTWLSHCWTTTWHHPPGQGSHDARSWPFSDPVDIAWDRGDATVQGCVKSKHTGNEHYSCNVLISSDMCII